MATELALDPASLLLCAALAAAASERAWSPLSSSTIPAESAFVGRVDACACCEASSGLCVTAEATAGFSGRTPSRENGIASCSTRSAFSVALDPEALVLLSELRSVEDAGIDELADAGCEWSAGRTRSASSDAVGAVRPDLSVGVGPGISFLRPAELDIFSRPFATGSAPAACAREIPTARRAGKSTWWPVAEARGSAVSAISDSPLARATSALVSVPAVIEGWSAA